jgi:hypothetical protein
MAEKDEDEGREAKGHEEEEDVGEDQEEDPEEEEDEEEEDQEEDELEIEAEEEEAQDEANMEEGEDGGKNEKAQPQVHWQTKRKEAIEEVFAELKAEAQRAHEEAWLAEHQPVLASAPVLGRGGRSQAKAKADAGAAPALARDALTKLRKQATETVDLRLKQQAEAKAAVREAKRVAAENRRQAKAEKNKAAEARRLQRADAKHAKEEAKARRVDGPRSHAGAKPPALDKAARATAAATAKLNDRLRPLGYSGEQLQAELNMAIRRMNWWERQVYGPVQIAWLLENPIPVPLVDDFVYLQQEEYRQQAERLSKLTMWDVLELPVARAWHVPDNVRAAVADLREWLRLHSGRTGLWTGPDAQHDGLMLGIAGAFRAARHKNMPL